MRYISGRLLGRQFRLRQFAELGWLLSRSHDVRTLMNRYANHIVALMGLTPLEQRNEQVLALEATPTGLLSTELFDGLFAGVSFEKLEESAQTWERMIEAAAPGSNSAQIGVSWRQSEFHGLVGRNKRR